MSQEEFYLLTVSNLPSDACEELTELAFRYEASGTEEVLAFAQNNLEYEPVTLPSDTTTIKIYFSSVPNHSLLEQIKTRWPMAGVYAQKEKNRDWLAEWKAQFKPFCLTDEIWIVPSWCKAPNEAKIQIQIDPGMAFGTGTHETTMLAAQFLSQYRAKKGSLIDVGTGTGILAIIAEKLGFKSIVANDIDPEARRVARENTALNKSTQVQVVEEMIEQNEKKFTWVVANIIDGVLLRLQEPLRRAVQPRGFLLLTGILSEREALFLEQFDFSEYEIVERKQLREWVGYLAQKKQ